MHCDYYKALHNNLQNGHCLYLSHYTALEHKHKTPMSFGSVKKNTPERWPSLTLTVPHSFTVLFFFSPLFFSHLSLLLTFTCAGLTLRSLPRHVSVLSTRSKDNMFSVPLQPVCRGPRERERGAAKFKALGKRR